MCRGEEFSPENDLVHVLYDLINGLSLGFVHLSHGHDVTLKPKGISNTSKSLPSLVLFCPLLSSLVPLNRIHFVVDSPVQIDVLILYAPTKAQVSPVLHVYGL